jgi:hypothetical protein
MPAIRAVTEPGNVNGGSTASGGTPRKARQRRKEIAPIGGRGSGDLADIVEGRRKQVVLDLIRQAVQPDHVPLRERDQHQIEKLERMERRFGFQNPAMSSPGL